MINLVMVGGGHSHAIALRLFAANPVPGLHLTLINDAEDTPYSGMLPGHIAGFYSRSQCHINLRRLTISTQAEFYVERVVNLDLEKKLVFCENIPPIGFDIVSIDIGSTPAKVDIKHVIPAKPVPQLLEAWYKICEEFPNNSTPMKIAVVGGGAGGVELTLAIQAGLQRLGSRKLEMHLFHSGRKLMSNYIEEALQQRGVELHLETVVSQIEKTPQGYKKLANSPDLFNHVFWVTQASAAPWIRKTGLAVDAEGFILVDETLESISHPHVFATGDIATMVNHPRPKAGVFAVRQGKPLFRNLRQAIQGKPLKPYIPQKNYLSLIGTGDGYAYASRGKLTLPPHKLLWYWKDYIDRQFMAQFQHL
jgi:pyridine nucleotide-disulfide oxidoreductase family protein